MRRPDWLRKRIDFAHSRSVKTLLKTCGVMTVCQEAACPNRGECFSRGVATFMILGNICTRNCSFCAVTKGKPRTPDIRELSRIRAAVAYLELRHVVITSPTRDDLSDGGAQHFFDVIRTVKEIPCVEVVEVLIPDFLLKRKALGKVLAAQPHIVGHNVETVPAFYPQIRPQADYKRSLGVLKTIKEINADISTKSGIMLGFSETDAQVVSVLSDLRTVGCDFVSIGQYLPPSHLHYQLKEYVVPEKFDYFKRVACSLGFTYVASAPYVRSSYQAESYLKKDSGRVFKAAFPP